MVDSIRSVGEAVAAAELKGDKPPEGWLKSGVQILPAPAWLFTPTDSPVCDEGQRHKRLGGGGSSGDDNPETAAAAVAAVARARLVALRRVRCVGGSGGGNTDSAFEMTTGAATVPAVGVVSVKATDWGEVGRPPAIHSALLLWAGSAVSGGDTQG